ncbi:zonadhesin-like [Chironomus tepperi]|uniref:zonadhesin-like n=1 Tax=Chironomus tepperi TaxID=113505 RepID=UPI00391F75A7
MKHVIVIAVCVLSLTIVSCDENCGSTAIWEPIGNTCKYRCTPDGVELDCSKPGCQCINFDHYYNLDTKSCSEVNCDSKNCIGRANEVFLTGCQSGSRENCERSAIATGDCRQGCMCKDGYCRRNGKCVPRRHPRH